MGDSPRSATSLPELLPDHAVTEPRDDRLRIKDVVDEVAVLAMAVQPPASIALYGPWGSGKSSVCALLSKRFPKDSAVRFFSVDAMKYQELPLRRHFLTQVKSQLKEKYKVDADVQLYTEETTTGVSLNRTNIVSVVVLLTFFVIAAALLVLGFAGLMAWARELSGREAFKAVASDWVPTILLTSTFLALPLTLAWQSLEVTRRREAPTSDEQFENAFRQLVTTALEGLANGRVVVFIDELDRCSPPQVAGVLDTLRTFLGVPGCVFVVAADQRVLEHALDIAVRQATPVDTANPYYSSGGSYLDKVFAYQLTIPPSHPRRLKSYAIELVEDLEGVWSGIENLADVVSVLIPTHVSSPRRVKHLLNAYALSYRLAERRAVDGAVDGPIAKRAEELAKLVCLRVEFPLFAGDLSLDPRLPSLVLLADEKKLDEAPGSVSEDVRKRAQAYADGRLPVEEILAGRKPSSGAPRPISSEESDGQEDDEVPSTGEADEPAAATQPENLTTDVRTVIRRAQAGLLVRYLKRTQGVLDPRRDLIFLESAGASFGLPGAVSDRLEFDAADAELAGVSETVKALTKEEQDAAVRLLTERLREVPDTLDRRNFAASLYAAIGAMDEGVDPHVAGDAIRVLFRHGVGDELEAADVKPALLLVHAAPRSPQRDRLCRVIAEHPAARSEGEVAEAIISSAALLRVEDVASVVAAWIRSGAGDRISAALIALEPTLRQTLLRALDVELRGLERDDGD